MLKVAKKDLALVFVAPIDGQLMLHCIYRICNLSTELFSVSEWEFKSSPSIIQLSSSKSSDLIYVPQPIPIVIVDFHFYTVFPRICTSIHSSFFLSAAVDKRPASIVSANMSGVLHLFFVTWCKHIVIKQTY